jgi:molybdopterin-guanine dinucleotide biosynthesis protein A
MKPSVIAGVVIAGGKSSRMGGRGKCLAAIAGRPLLARAIDRLRPQVPRLAINANGDLSRFDGFGVPVIADRIAGHAGPLAGLHAALGWAKALDEGGSHVVTVACDTPFLPGNLVERFVGALAASSQDCCVARSAKGVHPVIGLWPVSIADELATELALGHHTASVWAEQQRAVEVFFPTIEIGGREVDPFFNINRPEDLAEADALLGRGAKLTDRSG